MKHTTLIITCFLIASCCKDIDRCYQCTHEVYRGNNNDGYTLQADPMHERNCGMTTSEMLTYVAEQSNDTARVNEATYQYKHVRCDEVR